ncbi:MAG: hypothetical protein ABIJ37_00770 [Pseudomonadota bacterium]
MIKKKVLTVKFLVGMVSFLMLNGFLLTASHANTLPNGLQLVSFKIKTASPPLVGSKAHVEMTLKNLSGSPLKFSNEFGIFVASRQGDLGDKGNRDFGHGNKGLILRPGKTITVKASLTLDAAGNWWFWPGFNINGQWGPFQWMSKSLYVFASPKEAKLVGKVLMVADLLANPSLYDQKMVTVKGRAFIVRKKMSSKGQPWNLISFFDMKNDKMVINVFGPGHAKIGNGDIIQVTGIFKAKSKRGRYTFDNEIETRSEQIIQLEKAKY